MQTMRTAAIHLQNYSCYLNISVMIQTCHLKMHQTLQKNGEEFAVSDDSTDPCCVPSTTKKQKLWTSIPAASAPTTSTTAVKSTLVPVSEDLLSNLGQSTSELFLPITTTESTSLTLSPDILSSDLVTLREIFLS